jgi:hypothetical protein
MDAMSVGSAFGALTDLIERFEATGREVRRVVTEDVAGEDAGETADDGDDPLTVDLSVRTPLFGNIETDGIDLDVRDATVNEDGTATVALSASIPRSAPSRSRSTAGADGRDPDGSPERETGGTAERATNRTTNGNGSEPVHRDPDRLREVYATCDTFAEMTEVLGADVTSVTVRRNMIKHGIHEPRSNGSSAHVDGGSEGESDNDSDTDADAGSDDGHDSGSGPSSGSDDDHELGDRDDGAPADADEPSGDATASGDDESVNDSGSASDDDPAGSDEASTTAESADEPVAIPDGIGFPRDLTLNGVQEVVAESNTLYEAQTRFGLDRDRTRELLDDLGVLDLVHGRMSTRHERRVSPAAVGERIRKRCSRST